jgi:hypothetical protein
MQAASTTQLEQEQVVAADSEAVVDGTATISSAAPAGTGNTATGKEDNKDALISKLQRQLAHYRSWVGSVHARVLHMNPQAVQNAKRLYIGNLPQNITVVSDLCIGIHARAPC